MAPCWHRRCDRSVSPVSEREAARAIKEHGVAIDRRLREQVLAALDRELGVHGAQIVAP
jgi:hypothetical protein